MGGGGGGGKIAGSGNEKERKWQKYTANRHIFWPKSL